MSPAKGQTFQESQEPGESQLCVCCVLPNETSANFCSACGAPLNSYAATGPFERLFAEGHAYRQAVQRPRSLIVVMGVWMIFGPTAFVSLIPLLAAKQVDDLPGVGTGLVLIPISVVMIWKTTQNYLSSRLTHSRSGI